MSEEEMDALPLDTWIEVANEAGTFLLQRVPGGWYLPGDVVITSGDVLDGAPSSVVLRPDLFGEEPGDAPPFGSSRPT